MKSRNHRPTFVALLTLWLMGSPLAAAKDCVAIRVRDADPAKGSPSAELGADSQWGDLSEDKAGRRFSATRIVDLELGGVADSRDDAFGQGPRQAERPTQNDDPLAGIEDVDARQRQRPSTLGLDPEHGEIIDLVLEEADRLVAVPKR